jgi:hypothetical protein
MAEVKQDTDSGSVSDYETDSDFDKNKLPIEYNPIKLEFKNDDERKEHVNTINRCIEECAGCMGFFRNFANSDYSLVREDNNCYHIGVFQDIGGRSELLCVCKDCAWYIKEFDHRVHIPDALFIYLDIHACREDSLVINLD